MLNIKILFLLLMAVGLFKVQEKNDSLIPIKLKYNLNEDSIKIIFENTSTNKHYFLFSTYFKNRYINSKYLFRLNENNTYYFSFLPITNYIGTILSDKVIISDESIVNMFQSKYDFIKLYPKSQVSITIEKKLISDRLNNKRIIASFNPKNIKRNKIKSIQNKNDVDSIIFEFAIFGTLNLLTKIGAEFKESKVFKKEALSYNIINLNVGYFEITK